MLRDLLRGFVHVAWVKELDFTTLERVNASYVSDDLRENEDDIIAGALGLYRLAQESTIAGPSAWDGPVGDR